MGRAPAEGEGLQAVALAILEEPCADVKAQWTHMAAQLWREGQLACPGSPPEEGRRPLLPPDKPARDAQVTPLLATALGRQPYERHCQHPATIQ